MGSTGNKFDPLRASIKQGDVLVPGNAGYEESLKRWSDTCIKPAAVVVRPTSAEETSAAVRFATENKIPLVVKGGGHSTGQTSASDGGMVIDLGRLRSVTVDTEAQTATFGGGCTWKDVDDEAWKHGFATVGGTVNDTGVGGLILGGGYGYLSGQYGLSCDQLVEAQTVIADGRIVKSSETENADLFWALRGAGQSFGVTTSFTVRMHMQGKIFGGLLILPYESLPTVVDFTNKLHENQTGKEMLLFMVIRPPPAHEQVIMAAVFWDGPEDEGKQVFAPLLNANPIANMTSYRPYPEMNALLGDDTDRPRRKLMGGANFTMPLTLEYVQGIIDELDAFLVSKDIAADSAAAWELVPNRKIREVGITSTAFGARGDMYQLGILYQYRNKADDQDIRSFNRQLVTRIKEKGIKDNIGQYNNYEEEYLAPDVAFGQNAARLLEIKRKYDPENVFWKWHFIFPKTGTAARNKRV